MLLIGPSIPFRWREGHPRVQQHNRACPTVLADLSDSIDGPVRQYWRTCPTVLADSHI